MIKIKSKKCPCCGEVKEFEVEEKDYEKWKAGYFIQDAFPTMNAGDRERFLSGICPKCWEEMFGKEEEE